VLKDGAERLGSGARYAVQIQRARAAVLGLEPRLGREHLAHAVHREVARCQRGPCALKRRGQHGLAQRGRPATRTGLIGSIVLQFRLQARHCHRRSESRRLAGVSAHPGRGHWVAARSGRQFELVRALGAREKRHKCRISVHEPARSEAVVCHMEDASDNGLNTKQCVPSRKVLDKPQKTALYAACEVLALRATAAQHFGALRNPNMQTNAARRR
jgi:hypothetical protein